MIHDTGASINNEPSRDTESEREPETETETETASHSITDADAVEALQKGIREAARDNVSEELINEGEASLYYDSLTMSPLNAMSAAAIARFRAYKPPAFPLWDRLPVRRRAAVLILLYADRRGDLRVVITMRAASLRNFSGHAAFPGGKADDAQETPFQIARREAWEEIGLPMDDSKLPKPFRVEHLCYLPPSLARTHLVVRPCVAFLHADQRTAGEPAPTVDETMIPRLDAREVAAVFSAPFYNFLQANDLPPGPGEVLPEGRWYDGFWHSWKDHRWRVHNFYVPVNNQSISKPRKDSEQSQLVEKLEKEEEPDGRFKVWGMTARILVDAARIAYAQEPGFEHNDNIGDEDIIAHADSLGELGEKVQDKPQEKKTESGEAAKM